MSSNRFTLLLEFRTRRWCKQASNFTATVCRCLKDPEDWASWTLLSFCVKLYWPGIAGSPHILQHYWFIIGLNTTAGNGSIVALVTNSKLTYGLIFWLIFRILNFGSTQDTKGCLTSYGLIFCCPSTFANVLHMFTEERLACEQALRGTGAGVEGEPAKFWRQNTDWLKLTARWRQSSVSFRCKRRAKWWTGMHCCRKQ